MSRGRAEAFDPGHIADQTPLSERASGVRRVARRPVRIDGTVVGRIGDQMLIVRLPSGRRIDVLAADIVDDTRP